MRTLLTVIAMAAAGGGPIDHHCLRDCYDSRRRLRTRIGLRHLQHFWMGIFRTTSRGAWEVFGRQHPA